MKMVFGTIIGLGIWVLTTALLFFPMIAVGIPFWVQCILVLVILFLRHPFIAIGVQGLWIWGLIVCIKAPQQTWFEIAYYVCFVLEVWLSIGNAIKAAKDQIGQ